MTFDASGCYQYDAMSLFVYFLFSSKKVTNKIIFLLQKYKIGSLEMSFSSMMFVRVMFLSAFLQVKVLSRPVEVLELMKELENMNIK